MSTSGLRTHTWTHTHTFRNILSDIQSGDTEISQPAATLPDLEPVLESLRAELLMMQQQLKQAPGGTPVLTNPKLINGVLCDSLCLSPKEKVS